MNALTHAKLQAKDALFVTLDANVRTIDPATRPKILLSDTVGFIRNLPHSLVESFKSTLDEVLEADMLLHVVDVSHPSYRVQMETTQLVLNEIGAGDIPTIVVFNKLDNLDDLVLPKVLRQAYRGSICVSAYNEEDVIKLRKHIYEFFGSNFVRAQLSIPADDTSALSQVYNSCLVTETDYETPDVVMIEVKATRAVLNKLSAFIVKEYEPQKGSGREQRNVSRNTRNTFG